MPSRTPMPLSDFDQEWENRPDRKSHSVINGEIVLRITLEIDKRMEYNEIEL